jgi:hypothetical protein
MKKKALLVLAGALICSMYGCASLMNKEAQNLTFNSTPDDAEVVVDGMTRGKTPWTGPVKRKSVQHVVIRKEGYEPKSVELKGQTSGWVVANALFGLAGILSTSIDVGGGAGYQYAPDSYHVTLVSKSSSTEAAQQQLSEGALKRYVLMFYPDIAHDAVLGQGEKLDALRLLAGVTDRAEFAVLCRQELERSSGPDAFAERMVRMQAEVRPAGP